MSLVENRAFNFINVLRASFLRHCITGMQCFLAKRDFLPQMSKILHSEEHRHLSESINGGQGYIPERLTKIVALRKDLTEQRRTIPAIRAVSFTQFLTVHEACVCSLQRDWCYVYQYTGTSTLCKRDRAIRKFQDTSSCWPAVFMITLGSGNVGITLMAASRVYLLEPCLDPSVKVQAAGKSLHSKLMKLKRLWLCT